MTRFYCAHEMPFQIPTPADSRAPFLIPNALDDGAGGPLLDQYVEQLVQAEAAGFDALYLPRSAGGPVSMLSDPFAVAALVAARTSRAKVAVGELALGLLDPFETAQRVVMLDMISGGRAEAGITFGSGAAFWAATGRPGRARLQFAEAVALFLRALQDDGPSRFEGEHFMQRHLNLWPRASKNLRCFISGQGCPETTAAAEAHSLDYLRDVDAPTGSADMLHVTVFVGSDEALHPHLGQAAALAATTPNYLTPPGYLTATQYREALTRPATDPLIVTGDQETVAAGLQQLINTHEPKALVLHPHAGSMSHHIACANIDAIGKMLPDLKSAIPALA